jgi:hypothetical protein
MKKLSHIGVHSRLEINTHPSFFPGLVVLRRRRQFELQVGKPRSGSPFQLFPPRAAPHSELIQAKKATSVGLADSAVRIFYAELSKDVAHMGGYGILADAQALCDRLFAKPFGKEDDHLILSSGERLYSMRVFFINRCWDHFVLAS